MELPKQQSGKEFWLAHIKAAESFEGTYKEYCQLHGLNSGSFSAYRNKLGFSQSCKRKKALGFTQVQVSDPEPNKSNNKLPDPRWLAAFLKAWESQP